MSETPLRPDPDPEAAPEDSPLPGPDPEEPKASQPGENSSGAGLLSRLFRLRR